MNPWWEAVEKLVPGFVHPNVLTVSSCTCAIIGCCLLLGFCPYLSESPPHWVFLVAAALFFLYQTLDAIDGKHARRLALSSPLGQLMDHGCDILCTTPLTLLGTAIIGAGVGLRQYTVIVVSSQMLQFLYTWWELHFGVFYTATGIIGVTEAQLTVILLAVLGGFLGPEIYHMNLLQYVPTSIGIHLAKLAGAAGLTVTPSVVFQLMLLVWCVSTVSRHHAEQCTLQQQQQQQQEQQQQGQEQLYTYIERDKEASCFE
ncbi:ethanolaminephosphotransferase, putative [Eimeria brunetti]|uniref:Ethanolaminephosphotransferase, putative n=1 Tax=Eimeria brunetti TaxID=51314 RepID=U6LEF7_9EIME|nr:ethanolaminephosphotransferase, putative [Eimeria brunetti]